MAYQGSATAPFQPVARVDLLGAKLCVPVVPPRSVPRTPLVNRLRASGCAPVVTVLAPAGYGKTTALAQWADRDRRSFAWVSLEEDDDDPAVLSNDIEAALNRAQAVDSDELLSAHDPVVLVLDNIHLLRSRESVRSVAGLTEHLPEGTTLVLAGRALPRLPIARMRAAGQLFEVGVEELALSRREVSLLLQVHGVELTADEISQLADRTEGWATGAYLAVLSLKDGRPRPTHLHSVGGTDRFVVDYFDFEHLSRLSPKEVRFLTRTAVLDRMCGPLCDAMLESTGSARRLETGARESQFVVPLDRRREWYRYHHEFRDFLQAELERREPELVPDLNRRASAWYEANNCPEPAIFHARAAGDMDSLAGLIGKLALPMCSAGRASTVEVWIEWFEDERRLGQYPTVAALGAWLHLLRGRAAAANRWLGSAEHGTGDAVLPDGSGSLEPLLAVLRAAMCRDGVEQMRSDAQIAVRDLGVTSAWRPAALLLLGVAQLLMGESGSSDESLADAIEAAESAGATDILIVALIERSMLAVTRGCEADAEVLVAEARTLIDEGHLADEPLSALAYAAAARQSLRKGDLERARADLQRAHALVPQLTHGLPWHSVQTSLELARTKLAKLDTTGAEASLSAAAEILRRRPGLGVLGPQADSLRTEAARVAELCDNRTTILTTAELRLMPLLTTHLSFREIAERLYVSANTVKTQAISIYRKLDASSRSEAIARATDLGLVDATESPAGFIHSG